MTRVLLAIALCTLAFSAFAADAGNGPAAGSGPAATKSANETEVAVPAHDIARGDVLNLNDFTTKTISLIRANDSLLRVGQDGVGLEARRALRAGELIRLSDLKRPTLVAKGSTVTLVFEAPGMRLTSSGRAMAEGGNGDTIAVLNPVSYRQVQAVVVGPGTARVGASGNELAAVKQ